MSRGSRDVEVINPEQRDHSNSFTRKFVFVWIVFGGAPKYCTFWVPMSRAKSRWSNKDVATPSSYIYILFLASGIGFWRGPLLFQKKHHPQLNHVVFAVGSSSSILCLPNVKHPSPTTLNPFPLSLSLATVSLSFLMTCNAQGNPKLVLQAISWWRNSCTILRISHDHQSQKPRLEDWWRHETTRLHFSAPK